MKIIQLNHISHLRSITIILGFALISVNQVQSLDSRIAFSSDRDNPGENLDILVMKTNGSQVRNLTNNSASIDWDPSWSPDGQKIAFVSNRDGNHEIFVIDAHGRNPVQLTRDPDFDADPNWSPDGLRIAFVSERNGNKEIYVMDAEGKNVVRLTRHDWRDDDPNWSPDGRKIAFMSDRGEFRNFEIYVMSANGKNPVRLTRSPGSDVTPSWAPDGQKIVFTSYRDGNSGLYVMDADGKNVVRLTRHRAEDYNPSWAPDGRKIALRRRVMGTLRYISWTQTAETQSISPKTRHLISNLRGLQFNWWFLLKCGYGHYGGQ